MKDQVKRIHFVGIGGVGMAGIAEVCLYMGYVVSGSDLQQSPTVLRLISLGANVQIGHSASQVIKADVVVASTAIPEDNSEISWAREQRIPIIPRAAMLAELMRLQYGIAIAGTHGKTTTTSLTAAILTQGGVDPTYVIGGKLNKSGANARLGSSQYLVAEADESDASFLHLTPMMSVITNIDEDHMETYQGEYKNLENTFIEFVHRLPFYGLTILCIADENVRNIIPKLTRKIKTYGFTEEADVMAYDIKARGLQTLFRVKAFDLPEFDVCLNLPGNHNVLNSLAAITIALELEVKTPDIQTSLQEFSGVARRFEVYPSLVIGHSKVTLVDDYGHHPTELKATIVATRLAFPEKRLVLVFQPHRYSRTRDLFDGFVNALMGADMLIILDVYAAGETPLPAFDSKSLLQAVRLQGYKESIHVEDFKQLDGVVENVLVENDLLLVMGAGDIGKVVKNWVAENKIDE